MAGKSTYTITANDFIFPKCIENIEKSGIKLPKTYEFIECPNDPNSTEDAAKYRKLARVVTLGSEFCSAVNWNYSQQTARYLKDEKYIGDNVCPSTDEEKKEEEITEIKTPENNNITSMFRGLTGSTLTQEKEKVQSNIENTLLVIRDVKEKSKNLSLSDLGDVKLSTFASSLGIDVNKLSSLSSIMGDISLSNVDLSNTENIKKTLLDKVTEKGLTGDLLNKDLLENVGKSLNLNPTELENMFSSQNSVKILADIKSMEQFSNLDQTVKDKIAQNNFLPNTQMLTDVMNVSVDLNSFDKSKVEKAREYAKSLQPQFAKLFGLGGPDTNKITIPNQPNPTIPQSNFLSSAPQVLALVGEGDEPINQISEPFNPVTGVMGEKKVEKLPLIILNDTMFTYGSNGSIFDKNCKLKRAPEVFTPKGTFGEDRLTPDKTLTISKDGIVIHNGVPYSIREMYQSGLYPDTNWVQMQLENYASDDENDNHSKCLKKWIESMDAEARKSGRDPLKPILDYKSESDQPSTDKTLNGANNNTEFIENFDKLDYRVQKVAAESMGFTDDVGGVGKLKEVLNQMKEYKRLDELSNSLKETLLNHVEALNNQQKNNSDVLPTYKEQHNITDQQYQSAIDMAYSIKNLNDDENRFKYESNSIETLDDIKKEIDSSKIDNNTTQTNEKIPAYLGLDMSLFQKDSTGKIIEPFIYSGNVMLSDKKDENGNALTKIPIKFEKVLGNFICKNMSLTSLNNSPTTVTGDFDCSNNSLKNLVGGPEYVYGTYYAMNCGIESLKGIYTVKNLNISNNRLTNLDSTGGKQQNLLITGDGNFSNNLINSLDSNIDIYGELNLSKNYITHNSFEVDDGGILPKLYSNASLIINNQLNEFKLDVTIIRKKLLLNDSTKVVA